MNLHPYFVLKPINTERVVDRWDNGFFIIRPGNAIQVTRILNIPSDPDENIDEERYALVKPLFLSYYTRYNGNRSENFYAKFWNEDEDYEPAEPHLILNAQKKINKIYKEINLEELFYIEFPDESEIPFILKQRMGWVEGLTDKLNKLSEGIKEIFYETEDCFVLKSWPYLLQILNSIINVSDWLKSLSYGIWEDHAPSILIDRLTSFDSITNIIISNLTDLSELCYGCIIPSIQNLTNNLSEYSIWFNSNPWTEPITVKGSVSDVNESETVEISCRGITHYYINSKEQDDNIINFEFNVPSESDESESDYVYPHNCVITIKGDKHENIIETMPLLSYCYSGGTFEKQFSIKEEPTKNKEITDDSNIIKNVLNRISRYLEKIAFFQDF